MKKSEILNVAVKSLMAASVATLLAGAPAHAADTKTAGDGKVPCWGVNSCKGTGACGGKDHSCAGHNSCKGKGFLKMTKEECTKKGGKLDDPETKK